MGNTMKRTKGLFGNLKDMQTMFCLAISSQPDVYYCGTMNGSIYVWKGNKLEEIIPNVHDGAIYVLENCSDGFISAGRDGKLRFWDPNFVHLQDIEVKHLIKNSDGTFILF